MKKSGLLLIGCLLFWYFPIQAQTLTVTSFSPLTGTAGSSLTINGTGFNTTLANNKVFIGAVQATVTSATATKLVVVVPAKSSSKGGITVINTTTRLSYVTDASFVITYSGGVDPSNPAPKHYPSYVLGSNGPSIAGEGLGIGSGRKMVSGDFDLDGNIDFAVQGTVASNNLTVFRNLAKPNFTLSAPSFATGVNIALNANTVSISTETCDFNNDGKPDILMGGTNHFTVLVNTSTGTGTISFTRNTFSPTGTYNSQYCIAADMNKDGKPDVVAINPNRTSGYSLSIYLNTSNATTTSFNTTPTNITLTASIGNIIAVDIDSDGDKDLVFSTDNSSTENIYYLENTGTSAGSLSMASTIYVIASMLPGSSYTSNTMALAFADFDKDGKQDIISVSKSAADGTNQIVLLHRNNGGKLFTTLRIGNLTGTGIVAQSARVADLNGDGKQDIFFANNNGTQLYSIFNNHSSGELSVIHFTLHSTHVYAPGATGFVLEDFTGDGKTDIITNVSGSNKLLYMHNGNNTFYLTSTGKANANAFNSWSCTMDGAGSGPVDFNAGTFILDNTDATTGFSTTTALTLGGKLVIPSGKTLTLGSNQLTLNGGLEMTGKITGTGNININGSTAQVVEGEIDCGNLTINNAGGITKKDGTITTTNLTLTSGRLTLINGADLYLKGAISRTSGSIDGGGIYFIGTAAQTAPAGTFLSFYGLTIDNPAGVTINESNKNLPILWLNNGILNIGTNTITNVNLYNGSANSYVKVSGTGRFRRWAPGGPTFFPVGNDSYNPVTISNNTGTADYFGVSVQNEVLTNGTTGTPLTSARVKRTWDITKDKVNSGNGVDFIFKWNSGDASGVTVPGLFHYEGGKWVLQTGGGSYTTNTMTFTGYKGSFSPFYIGDISTLPVTWLDFTAKQQQQQILLTWQTSAEWDAKDFVVQHSTNGKDWISIGTIAASGNSTLVSSYRFEHRNPVSGKNYYRLMQRDLNGSSTFSKVISVNWEMTKGTVSVYPTPVVNGILNVQLKEAGEVILVGMGGEVVLRKHLPSGIHQLNLVSLPKAVYSLKAGNELIRVVVQ